MRPSDAMRWKWSVADLARRSCGLAVAAVLAATPAAGAGPALAFDVDRVTATGVTPAGRAVVLSVSRQRGEWIGLTTPRVATVLDTDGDGAVDYLPGGDLADRSLWAVVDLESGEFVVGAPDGFTMVETEVDPPAMASQPGLLTDPRCDLELLVVRPGVGAWHGRAGDGADGDDDGVENGAVALQLSALDPVWPVYGGVLLDRLRHGDVVIGIDPLRLTYYAFGVGVYGKGVG